MVSFAHDCPNWYNFGSLAIVDKHCVALLSTNIKDNALNVDQKKIIISMLFVFEVIANSNKLTEYVRIKISSSCHFSFECENI